MIARAAMLRLLRLATAAVLTTIPSLGAGEAAYLVVLGRTPRMTDARSVGATLPDQIATLEKRLADDPVEQRHVVERSYRDAFGRRPTDAEHANAPTVPATYAQWMRRHVTHLSDAPHEYEEIIDRAYLLVIHRKAFREELAYWRDRGVVPFALLVACIDNWARRNQPGLMVTTGSPTVAFNCAYLQTARVPAADLDHFRRAFQSEVDSPVISASRVPLKSDGGIVFVAAGNAALAP